jgi:hypothetical protein
MSHQPFETWIFTQEDLTPEQAQELQEHLQECDQCYGLAAAWRHVEPLIVIPPMVAPEPGFVARWQLRLEKERLSLQRRQSLLVFVLGAGSAFVFLAMMAAMVLFRFNSPLDWLLALASQVISLLFMADTVRQIYGVLLSTVPLGWWVAGWAAIFALCLLWVYSLQKAATNRRHIPYEN